MNKPPPMIKHSIQLQLINDSKEGNGGEASITRGLLENARNRLGNVRTITITATTLTYLVANIEGEMFMLYSHQILQGGVPGGILNITSSDKKIR